MEKADFVQMMKGYAEVSKTYTQLAVGSLVIPLTFIRDLLGVSKDEPLAPYIGFWLWMGWGGFLLCIASGMMYQTVAARRIAEYTSGTPHRATYPRLWYNLSIVAFFVGLVFLVIGVVGVPQIPTERPAAGK